MTPSRYALLLTLAASTLVSSAQTLAAKKIVFKNLGTFTQSQLEAATGLDAGCNAAYKAVAYPVTHMSTCSSPLLAP